MRANSSVIKRVHSQVPNQTRWVLIQLADKGTFFVDEVADMSPAIQAKLLRVIETGVSEARGYKGDKGGCPFRICTNKSIEEEVRTNRFRKDLFYRLNTFIITIPPLRARRDDIPLLTDIYYREAFKVR